MTRIMILAEPESRSLVTVTLGPDLRRVEDQAVIISEAAAQCTCTRPAQAVTARQRDSDSGLHGTEPAAAARSGPDQRRARASAASPFPEMMARPGEFCREKMASSSFVVGGCSRTNAEIVEARRPGSNP